MPAGEVDQNRIKLTVAGIIDPQLFPEPRCGTSHRGINAGIVRRRLAKNFERDGVLFQRFRVALQVLSDREFEKSSETHGAGKCFAL